MQSQVKQDLEYLLKFVPATDPQQVQPDLPSVCYITGTFEGDIEVAERVKNIVCEHELTVPEEGFSD